MSRNRPRITQNTVRVAISETVRALQGNKTDHEMAEEWGQSANTVANARNRNHTIGLEAFLRLGKEWGAEGVDGALSLVGLKAVPTCSITIDVAKVPHRIALCLPIVMERLADGDWSDADQAAFEAAGVVSTFLTIADKMREQRDARRLRSVGE